MEERRDRLSQYWFVIRELTSREIKRRYARSRLGILWSVLSPLLTMAVLSLVFSQLWQRSIENFPIYYLTAYILWQLFTQSTNQAMTSLMDNKNLLMKVKLPMRIFVLSRVYTAFINFLYSLIGFAAMICVFRTWPGWTMFFSPVIVFFLVLFSLGVAYILATAHVFFGDIRYLYTVFLTLVMYLSALFYPVDRLGSVMQTVIRINPIFEFFDSMRSLVLYRTMPTFSQMLYIAIWSVGLYLLGRFVFNRNRNNIMKKI